MPRAAGALVVLLGVAALGVLILILVVGGIVSQTGQISSESSAAAGRVQGWLQDAGISQSGASDATSSLKADVPDIFSKLVSGIASGIQGVASLAFAVSFTALLRCSSCSRTARRFAELGRSPSRGAAPVARMITGEVITRFAATSSA